MTRSSTSVAKFECDAAVLKAAIDTHVAKTKGVLHAELQARIKALDSQLDGLNMSASQLAAHYCKQVKRCLEERVASG